MELWVPGLCGDHLERWSGVLKGKTMKLIKFPISKITQQDLQKLLQDLPPPRVFITHSITVLPRNNNYPHTLSLKQHDETYLQEKLKRLEVEATEATFGCSGECVAVTCLNFKVLVPLQIKLQMHRASTSEKS